MSSKIILLSCILLISFLGAYNYWNRKSSSIHDLYQTKLQFLHTIQQNGHNTYIFKQDVSLSQEGLTKFAHSPFAQEIRVTIIEDSDNELTLKITDNLNDVFEVPEDHPYFPSNENSKDTQTGNRNYQYTVDPQTGVFLLKRVLKDGTTETIFDTSQHKFAFSKYYNHIGTTINNDYTYGFGERRKSLRYTQSGKYTIFPKDQFATIDFFSPNQQLYGYHPMWLQKEQSGNFHVGFLKSTSALQIEIEAGKSIGFHIVGGAIHLKFFLGDEQPENVIKAYHRYIKGFSLHPFWSQGYHQLRWGYHSSKELIEVRDKFDQYDFPVDVIWNDLDYMQDYQDFTINDNYKPEEMNYLTNLEDKAGVRWIPLIDIGVAIHTEAAEDGIRKGVFLNSSIYDRPLIACVWPGSVYVPDFNHPASYQYWNESLYSMNTVLQLNPSGYWIDMNEISSFIAGERDNNEMCPPAEPDSPPPVKPEIDDSTYLPFSVAGEGMNLANKTLTMSAKHYNGNDALLISNQDASELFFHPLNSLGEQIITHDSLQTYTKSPLIFSLTRASIYGSGRFSQHWTGDNYASWDFFQYAVSELIPFNFYGMPMVGQDLCGFGGDTTEELCSRWLSLGAWTPFSRNHNRNTTVAQEPYAFGEKSIVFKASQKAFKNRYAHLKWLYSLFVRQYETDIGFGVGTVMRPIWWQFPDQEIAYKYEDSMFMMGNEYLIAPVLVKGNDESQSTEIDIYLPKGYRWFEPESGFGYQGGQEMRVNVGYDEVIPAFQRGGSIVSKQVAENRARRLNNRYQLSVALQDGQAEGEMMTIDSFEDNHVYEMCLVDSNCICNIKLRQNGENMFVLDISGRNEKTVFERFVIDQVNFYGLEENQIVTLNVDILVTENASVELNLY